MLACEADQHVAIEGAFQIVPKSQQSSSSTTRQQEAAAAGKKEGKKKKLKRNFQPTPGGIEPKNLN